MIIPWWLHVKISTYSYFFPFSAYAQDSITFYIALGLFIILLDPVISLYLQFSSVQFHRPVFLKQISFYFTASSIDVPAFSISNYHTSFDCQCIPIQVHSSNDLKRISLITDHKVLIQGPASNCTLYCYLLVFKYRIPEIAVFWTFKADLLQAFSCEYHLGSICCKIICSTLQLGKVSFQGQRSCTVAVIRWKSFSSYWLRIKVSSNSYFFLFSLHSQHCITFHIAAGLRIVLLDPVISFYLQGSSAKLHFSGFLEQVSLYLTASSIDIESPTFPDYYISFNCQLIAIHIHVTHDFQWIALIMDHKVLIQNPIADCTLYRNLLVFKFRMPEITVFRGFKTDLLQAFSCEYHLGSICCKIICSTLQLGKVSFQGQRSCTVAVIRWKSFSSYWLRIKVSSNSYFFLFSLHSQHCITFHIAAGLRIILLDPVISFHLQGSLIKIHCPWFLKQVSLYLTASSVNIESPTFPDYYISFNCQLIAIHIHVTHDLKRISLITDHKVLIQNPVSNRTLYCYLLVFKYRISEITVFRGLKINLLRAFSCKYHLNSTCSEIAFVSLQLREVSFQSYFPQIKVIINCRLCIKITINNNLSIFFL